MPTLPWFAGPIVVCRYELEQTLLAITLSLHCMVLEPVLVEADGEKVQSAAPDSKYDEQKGDGIEKQ